MLAGRKRVTGLAFVARRREVVRAQEIPHDADPTGFVTASFGVGWWGPQTIGSLTPGAMYAEVDRQLYHSKSGGRSRATRIAS